MATYDLDRWTRSILRSAAPGAATTTATASLVLHLYESYCRFEHQNGTFLYDSPILTLLHNIRDARLPLELIDLLDAAEVTYYEGCLVVEVHDHRGFPDEEAEAATTAAAAAAAANAAGASQKDSGTDANGQPQSSSSATGAITTTTVLGKRNNDGSLVLDPAGNNPSTNKAGTSSSSSGDPANSSAQGTAAASTSGQATAGQQSLTTPNFIRRFLLTFSRWEEARSDTKKYMQARRDKFERAAKPNGAVGPKIGQPPRSRQQSSGTAAGGAAQPSSTSNPKGGTTGQPNAPASIPPAAHQTDPSAAPPKPSERQGQGPEKRGKENVAPGTSNSNTDKASKLALSEKGIPDASTAGGSAATGGERQQQEQSAEDVDREREKPPVYRVVLGPESDTVWNDLSLMREVKKNSWSTDEMLQIESRVLALTAPPLCLSTDMQVSRIANQLLDATSLPFESPYPSLAPYDPPLSVPAALPTQQNPPGKKRPKGVKKIDDDQKRAKLIQKKKKKAKKAKAVEGMEEDGGEASRTNDGEPAVSVKDKKSKKKRKKRKVRHENGGDMDIDGEEGGLLLSEQDEEGEDDEKAVEQARLEAEAARLAAEKLEQLSWMLVMDTKQYSITSVANLAIPPSTLPSSLATRRPGTSHNTSLGQTGFEGNNETASSEALSRRTANFQASFSRLAFLQKYKEQQKEREKAEREAAIQAAQEELRKKKKAKEDHQMQQQQRDLQHQQLLLQHQQLQQQQQQQAQQAQQSNTDSNGANGTGDIAIPQSGAMSSNKRSASQASLQSRQNSVIDVPVPGSSTAATDNSEPATGGATNQAQGPGGSNATANPPKTKKGKKAAAKEAKEKEAKEAKEAKENAKAGAANGGGGAADNSASGPSGLKLTLPGKKKGKNAAGKAGSPDISVNTSNGGGGLPSSQQLPPNSAASNASNAAQQQGGSGGAGGASQPTVAQQAINRKTANLPKAKLKSDVKAAAAGQNQQSPSNQQQQGQGSPAMSNASPGTATSGVPNAVQQMVNGLMLPSTGNNDGSQNQNNGSPQRFASPLPINNMLPGQQQQGNFNLGNLNFANLNGAGGMNAFNQQHFAQPNQAQAQAFQQAYMNQLQQNGMLQGRQMSSSPFGNSSNTNNSATPNNNSFMNIHRSPVYNNANLPNQHGQGYNPYQPSGSPSAQQQQQNAAQGGFSPQQAFQLQQLQQQQQQLHQHQQALQAFSSSMPQSFGNGQIPNNALNNANLANLFQQIQQQVNQSGGGGGGGGGGSQGPNGQPQIQIPPPGQQGGNAGGGGMNMPQFNATLLNQLRQQQLMAGQPQQGGFNGQQGGGAANQMNWNPSQR